MATTVTVDSGDLLSTSGRFKHYQVTNVNLDDFGFANVFQFTPETRCIVVYVIKMDGAGKVTTLTIRKGGVTIQTDENMSASNVGFIFKDVEYNILCDPYIYTPASQTCELNIYTYDLEEADVGDDSLIGLITKLKSVNRNMTVMLS